MKTFKTFVSEMAKDIGVVSYNPLDKEEKRKEFYENSKNHPHESYPTGDENIESQKIVRDGGKEKQTEYHVNDHNKGETIFKSFIVTHNPTKRLPFKHDEQIAIDKKQNAGLPRGYGRDVIYNHFKNSEHPLRSSDLQFHQGHDMWRDLAHRALADGHHVYYHNGHKLYKTTPKNIDKHLADYFGTHDSHINSHMILSKTEL